MAGERISECVRFALDKYALGRHVGPFELSAERGVQPLQNPAGSIVSPSAAANATLTIDAINAAGTPYPETSA